MSQDFVKQVRTARFELKERYSDDQIKHAHEVFRRIAKTALRYSVSGEPADVVVESAKNKHGTSLAGLQGSFGSIWGKPFDCESEDERDVWWDRSWRAYEDFEQKFTEYLVGGMSNLSRVVFTPSNAGETEKLQRLGDKIRARNADLREKVTDSTKMLASEIFREICAATSKYEAQDLSAFDAVEQATAEKKERFALLTETLKSELVSGICDNGRGWTLDRATARSKEVVGFFIRDIKSFLIQQIVELRTERIENAPNQ